MSKHYQLAKHVSFTELDEEAVLLDLNNGTYFGLNHVGVMLVNELEKGANQQQAETQIAEHYKVPNEQVSADVASLIDEMLAQKLLLKV